jgi:hypothetical protein
MSEWKTCTVGMVGPAADGTETPDPVVYINMSAQDNSFTGQWFYASQNAKNEMLAVALMARNLSRNVNANVDTPNAGGVPYTAIHRLYLA